MPSTPLIDPEASFSQRTPSLGGAAVILVSGAVIGVASFAPFAGALLPDGISTEMLLFAIVLGAAGIWASSTVLVYLLSSLAGGSGPMTRVAAGIGWSSLPLLFGSTVTTALMWSLAYAGYSPSITAGPSLYPFWLVVVNTVTGVLTYLWIGYILTYAICETRNLSVRQSAPIAGIVIAIPILYALSALF